MAKGGLEASSSVSFSTLALSLLLLAPQATSQTQPTPRKADSAVGEVTAVDAPRLALRLDGGDTLSVGTDDKTSLLRAKPGATNLADATPLSLDDLSVGDRILVRGRLSEDHRSFTARQVVVMTKADISQKHESEQAEWRRRGLLGTVTAVDAAKGEITLQPRRGGDGTIVIPTSDRKITFRRYAPDSVKFSDAKSSRLAEVQVGDQLRALGDRTPDGSQFLAEQVVFGSFRTVVGDVVSVDGAKGHLTLKTEDATTVSVSVGSDARVRRLPAEMAARLAAPREAPGGGAPGPGPGAAGAGGGGWGGGRAREGGGGEDLLDRLPAATLVELKPGDRILVSSTKGSDATRLTAIAVVAGLEAFRAPMAARREGGGRGPAIGLPSDLMDLGMGVQ
jgi:hypothetical protein